MICPKCKKKQYCPCPNCKPKNPGKIFWIWETGNGPIKCGNCGHYLGLCEWRDVEFRQYEEADED
jgi:hypothetical protein